MSGQCATHQLALSELLLSPPLRTAQSACVNVVLGCGVSSSVCWLCIFHDMGKRDGAGGGGTACDIPACMVSAEGLLP
jgi:hypothetical protein